MDESRNAYRVLVGRLEEGKNLLEMPTRRWEDNIKMDLRRWDIMVQTGLIFLRIGHTAAEDNQRTGRLKSSPVFTSEVIVINVLEEDRRMICADIPLRKLRPKIRQNRLQLLESGELLLYHNARQQIVEPLAQQVLNVNRRRQHATVSPYSQKEKKNEVLSTYLVIIYGITSVAVNDYSLVSIVKERKKERKKERERERERKKERKKERKEKEREKERNKERKKERKKEREKERKKERNNE
ncbi:hypothetical protein ANN_05287 [Periplaneta americana]|uniref:Uncharacterized protein n=1 Tax=Periplaneta americana TaxID=6978 RepID=A0ABQ8TCH3_PERAM|nr:hypothetical protein ANN_05287 [Periplaneta americana]